MKTASRSLPNARIAPWLRRFLPHPTTADGREWLRAGCGALLGILVTAWLSHAVAGAPGAFPLLIAPMGASSVLLFAAPASPLAQPWSIIGGNILAALVGVTCARWIGDPTVAAAVAVAGAIALMFPLRCLHPPSGAVALTAVLGGPEIINQGYAFVAAPVALNSIVLLLMALVFNALTGRSYPHVAPAQPVASHGTADPAPGERVGLTQADLDAVLKAHNEVIDVDRDDLAALYREAEMRAYHRRFGAVACADIMSRDVIAVTPDTRVARVRDLLHRHHIKAIPVIDAERRVIGIVTPADGLALGTRIAAETAADLMTTPARTARTGDPITGLVPTMSDGGLHHVPVVDEDGRLVGIVTQSDLIAGLYRGRATLDADGPNSGDPEWRQRRA